MNGLLWCQLDQRARAAVVIDELGQVSVGNIEDVYDDPHLARRQAMVGQMGAKPDTFEVTIAARRLPLATSRRTRW